MNTLASFAEACATAESVGLEVVDARFDGRHFGYWHIEVARKNLPPRRLLWEARDGCFILQSQKSDGAWDDELIVRDPKQNTARNLVADLGK